jgi:hypothetical protein
VGCMLYGTPSTHTEMQQTIKNITNQDYHLLKKWHFPPKHKQLAYGLSSINTPGLRTVSYINKEF